MCKKLVSMEVYDNMRTAFRVLEYLRNETGMAWSMYKAAPDEYGHTLFEIYGTFDVTEIECVNNAINSINETSVGIYHDNNLLLQAV